MLLDVYQNEVVVHAWVEAFFFRVSAMVPPNETMVLNVGQRVPCSMDAYPSDPAALYSLIAVTADKSNASKIVI